MSNVSLVSAESALRAARELEREIAAVTEFRSRYFGEDAAGGVRAEQATISPVMPPGAARSAPTLNLPWALIAPAVEAHIKDLQARHAEQVQRAREALGG